MLNFGAFIAFIAVNAAALVHYRFRSKERVFLPATLPTLGMLICAFIWYHLDIDAKVLGTIWVAVGLLVYLLMRKTRKGRPAGESEA